MTTQTETTGTTAGRALSRARRIPPGLVVASAVLIVLSAWALLPDLFAGSPYTSDTSDRFLAPGGSHPFGTDYLGRDLYARVVHGTSLSLRSAVLATLIGLTGGTLLGVSAAMAGGGVDSVVMRIVDVLLAVPALLLSLLVVSILSFDAVSVALAVGVGSVAGFARLSRSEVLRVKQEAFVEAAVASGLHRWQVVARHVVPHAFRPLVALATIEFAGAILAISALTFLGFGAQPPTPEWGALVSNGADYLVAAPWLTAIPGAVIVIAVLSLNRIGQELRER